MAAELDVLGPDGDRLFLSHMGSNSTSVFDVSPQGALSAVAGSPFPNGVSGNHSWLALREAAAGSPAVCETVNGITWCYDNSACGEACEDVCTSLGMALTIDDQTCFEAQNEDAECQALSLAFGFGGAYSLDSYTYACLEDEPLVGDVVGGGLTGTLLCSNYDGCPAEHRTNMDELGVACGQPAARRSICPCTPS